MYKFNLSFTISIFLLAHLNLFSVGCNAQSSNQEKAEYSWLIDDLVVKWENNKKYTLQVIQLMPEENFGFIPAEGMRSFREQLTHAGNGFSFQLGKTDILDLPKVNNTSKDELLTSYTQIFDQIIVYIKQSEDKLNKEVVMFYGNSTHSRIFNLMDHHLAHHRGQMIVYLRLKGIKPPAYIGW